MKITEPRALLIALTLLLTSCSMISIVEPGEVVIKERMTVTVPKAWNRYDPASSEFAEAWTADGIPLDNLWFYAGVGNGKLLRPVTDRNEKKAPRFQANMTPTEIVEIVETLTVQDGSTFKLERLTTDVIADGRGFRFDFRSLRKRDEVEIRGSGFGTIRGDRLYLILYSAPATYYYNKHISAVEAIARSLKIKN